jgi:hypothetical protein
LCVEVDKIARVGETFVEVDAPALDFESLGESLQFVGAASDQYRLWLHN